MTKKNEEYIIKPIGYARQSEDGFFIEILKPYIPALKQLEHFSHAQIFWWANKNDDEERRSVVDCTPPYGENPPITGVFATRSEFRPNPIALTTVNVLHIDHEKGLVIVPYIDAFDGTPIVDIKGYFPICDRVRDCHIPGWLKDWPEWYEDAAEFWAAQGYE